MKSQPEDSPIWTFKKDTNGRWIWLRYSPQGEALTASRQDFDYFDECVADARQRGYDGTIEIDGH